MLTLEFNSLPKQLRSIADPPKKIYSIGKPLSGYQDKPLLAVVGSRKVSAYGRQVTERLVTELASSGVVIVSGLALGVDSIAHAAALKAGGETIAVVPGSITRIYPRSHTALAKQIEKNGAVISEHSGDYQPREYDFLIRNRIISGLCSGVLVTEAAIRSGSLNTAKHALEQGRTVFSVPGNITSDTSGGTNQLIKMGAVPVTEASDIFHALGWQIKRPDTTPGAHTPAEKCVIDILKTRAEGLSGEELLMQSGLEPGMFFETMTALEISGAIRPLGANIWTLS